MFLNRFCDKPDKTKNFLSPAEESLSLVAQQYEGGSATVTRYLEAELACNQARLSQAAAINDREKAVADIARAIGYLAVAYPVGIE